jgi:hypothetical protein
LERVDLQWGPVDAIVEQSGAEGRPGAHPWPPIDRPNAATEIARDWARRNDPSTGWLGRFVVVARTQVSAAVCRETLPVGVRVGARGSAPPQPGGQAVPAIESGNAPALARQLATREYPWPMAYIGADDADDPRDVANAVCTLLKHHRINTDRCLWSRQSPDCHSER